MKNVLLGILGYKRYLTMIHNWIVGLSETIDKNEKHTGRQIAAIMECIGAEFVITSELKLVAVPIKSKGKKKVTPKKKSAKKS
jgi:hypothetical protein